MSSFERLLGLSSLTFMLFDLTLGQRDYWLNIRTANYSRCSTSDTPSVKFINSIGQETSQTDLTPTVSGKYESVSWPSTDIGDIAQLKVDMGNNEDVAYCFDRFTFGIKNNASIHNPNEPIARECSMEFESYRKVEGNCDIGDDTGSSRRVTMNVSDTSPICRNIYNSSLTNKTEKAYWEEEGYQFVESKLNTSITRDYEIRFTTYDQLGRCASTSYFNVELQSNCTFHQEGGLDSPRELYSQCISDRVISTTTQQFIPPAFGEVGNVTFSDYDIGDITHMYLTVTDDDTWCIDTFDVLLKPNALEGTGQGDKWVSCNIGQILFQGIGLSDKCDNDDDFTMGFLEYTLRVDEYAPYCDVYYVATSAPTFFPTSPPTDYDCYIGEDDVIVSWDDLISGENGGENFTASINITSGTNNITGIFEVNVNVKSKYVVGSTFSAFTDYYESVFEDGYLGITYVLDTNEFTPNGRLLSNANTCENRLESSFNNTHFLNDYWTYTLSPNIDNRLGNDDFGLEYGNQNIWDISMVVDDANNTCGNVQWTNTFTFYDLWNQCRDSNGLSSYELIDNDNDNTISLNLNFYLTLVSPNPLWLESCDSGASDCGQYLIKSLISHPLSIIFSKQQNIISTKDSVSIVLFTSYIIGSSFIETTSNTNSSGVFTLYLLTSVPNFMSLNVDSSLILSPTMYELVLLNNNLDFIKDYSISEDTSSYYTESCLIKTDYRCFQQWEISIAVNQCPSDTGLVFDGSYYFSADFDCIANDTNICDEYLSDEPLSITFDGVDLKYNELCDSTLYEIDWNGDITFYYDETFDNNSTTNEFELGDTVFVRVSIENDISNYDIFGAEIVQCYVCSSNISDENDAYVLESCVSASADNGLMYIMPADSSLEFTNINSNTSDTYEDFSFVLPPIADNIFYVDCTIELTINNNVLNNRRARSRSLLQTNNNGGNSFENFIGSASITKGGDNSVEETNTEGENGNGNNNNNDDAFGSVGILLIVLIGVVSLLIIIVICGFIYYFKIYQMKKQNAMMKSTLKNENNIPTFSASASARQSVDTPV